MTVTLKITFTCSSYDEDVEFLVNDLPRVRKALGLRAELIAECGDGSQDVEVSDKPANTTEEDFLDWLVSDIDADGHSAPDIYAAIEEAGR